MGISWLLEFDIRKCYDTIDRHRLVSIFLEKIHDQPFSELILKLFQARATRSQVYFFLCVDRVGPSPEAGVPQGSVISPPTLRYLPERVRAKRSNVTANLPTRKQKDKLRSDAGETKSPES